MVFKTLSYFDKKKKKILSAVAYLAHHKKCMGPFSRHFVCLVLYLYVPPLRYTCVMFPESEENRTFFFMVDNFSLLWIKSYDRSDYKKINNTEQVLLFNVCISLSKYVPLDIKQIIIYQSFDTFISSLIIGFKFGF